MGKLYNAPLDVYLDDTNVFQPDLLFVSKNHYSILTDAGVEGAPDFIVEILSPKTAKLDLENKRLQYAKHGVQELWIIDPKARTIAIHRFHENPTGPVGIHQEGEILMTPFFPGLKIESRKIFLQ
ncbi:MAG: Uma2 family endonuclease [Verrucomicrobiales bacterium]